MKTTNTTKKSFDAVEFMRQQRANLSEKLMGMTKAEIVEYFQKRKLEALTKPGA